MQGCGIGWHISLDNKKTTRLQDWGWKQWCQFSLTTMSAIKLSIWQRLPRTVLKVVKLGRIEARQDVCGLYLNTKRRIYVSAVNLWGFRWQESGSTLETDVCTWIKLNGNFGEKQSQQKLLSKYIWWIVIQNSRNKTEIGMRESQNQNCRCIAF